MAGIRHYNPLNPSGEVMPTSFYLDDDTRELLNELVLELGISRSAVVRAAIKNMHSGSDTAEIRRLVSKLHKAVASL